MNHISFKAIGLLSIVFLCSCADSTKKAPAIAAEQTVSAVVDPPAFSSQKMEVHTFEVIDSVSRKSSGWGYDIYVEGKKAIHQPIIPAVPGNSPFSSEQKARTTGDFAVKKMKTTGSLPTLTIEELDSLGVTK